MNKKTAFSIILLVLLGCNSVRELERADATATLQVGPAGATLQQGQTLRDQQDKMPYQFKYCLLSPIPADRIKHQLANQRLQMLPSTDIRFQDETISVSFSVGVRTFGIHLQNFSSYPLKILWDRAEYTDFRSRRFRLMHSDVRFQDRNNPIPCQIVRAGASLHESLAPVEHIMVSPKNGSYEITPLFDLLNYCAAALKGKTFTLFIPVETNRTIIPYTFRIGIADVGEAAAEDASE